MRLLAKKSHNSRSVLFAGFVVDQDGNKPDPFKMEAIKNFPSPKDLTNLKSYLGLTNQLGEFCPDRKHSLKPLKPHQKC